MTTPAAPPPSSKPQQVAPLWHTAILLLALLAISLGLFRMQSGTGAANVGVQNAALYLIVIASEWALVFLIWLGGRSSGALPLRGLIGGRWNNIKVVLSDVGVAAVFWIVWTVAAIGMTSLVGPSHTESMRFLHPQGEVEVTLWVVMSLTAGFCEELVYRGYLQKQALALTGSAVFAVLIQAVIFGVGHWYQGIKQVVVITVLGALFGILAQWRQSLRPGMISHAWSDTLNVIPIRFP